MHAAGPHSAMLSSLRESMEAGVAQEEERQDRARRPQLSSRLPTSFSTLTILAVVLCGLLVETRAAASGSRVLLEDPNHQPEFVAQGVRANAKSIEHAVDGIKKAVDSVKLEMATQKGPADDAPQLKSAPPEHDKLQTLSSSEEKVQKMKASVHAAAMIKQNAILHQHHEEAAKNADSAKDADSERGRQTPAPKVLTLHQPKWFAEGPYFIIGLLVTIFFTFCYCACSSQPTSMSNKYDMR